MPRRLSKTATKGEQVTFRLGQRVRTTVDAPEAPGFEWGAPAGTLGTIVSPQSQYYPGEYGGYGVLLDGDPYQLPAHYKAHEFEALDAEPDGHGPDCPEHPTGEED